MIFLAVIISLGLVAERLDHFIVPMVAILIRGFYKNGVVVIGRAPLVIALVSYVLLQITQFITHDRTFANVLADWTVMRLATSMFLVMVCLQNFHDDYTDNPWLPAGVRTFVFHMVRAFTVLRSQGEEAKYTARMVCRYVSKRSYLIELIFALTTYLAQIAKYVDNRALVMDSRGGFPAISLWRGAARKGLDHWGDVALIALLIAVIFLGGDQLFPASIIFFLAEGARNVSGLFGNRF